MTCCTVMSMYIPLEYMSVKLRMYIPPALWSRSNSPRAGHRISRSVALYKAHVIGHKFVPRGEVRAARRALAHRAGAMLAEQTGVRCLHFVAPSSNRGSAGRCHSAPGTGRGFATASPSKSPHRNSRSLRFKVTAVLSYISAYI